MSFRRVSTVVREAWLTARRVPLPPASVEPRMAAAMIAAETWGRERVAGLPELVNVAALALTARDRLVLHEVRPGVCSLVDATDLHSLPMEAPRLLRGAWIIESKRETDALFGSTCCLGGYPLDGAIYLFGLQYPDGALVARWTPHWDGGELDAGVVRDTSPLIDDVDAHHAWSREAARFALVFGALLDAEGSPIVTRDEQDERAKRKRGTPQARDAEAWTTRHVTLDAKRTAHTPDGPLGDATTPEGRIAAAVQVRGHLKRQRHGEGRALTKYVYVESYEARRWVAPAVRVVVRA